MRKGIHRGYISDADKEPRRAWVSEAPGEIGEWLSEDEYRESGYSPNFESLPFKVVERVGTVPISADDLPEADRIFLKQLGNKPKV